IVGVLGTRSRLRQRLEEARVVFDILAGDGAHSGTFSPKISAARMYSARKSTSGFHMGFSRLSPVAGIWNQTWWSCNIPWKLARSWADHFTRMYGSNIPE